MSVPNFSLAGDTAESIPIASRQVPCTKCWNTLRTKQQYLIKQSVVRAQVYDSNNGCAIDLREYLSSTFASR
jgi:hypothetical protein